MRLLNGLKWAAPSQKPYFLGPIRAKGTKRLGLLYEKKVAKAIPSARHGQWFEYEDANGRGFCQTDLLLEGNRAVYVIEVKLTEVTEAREKLVGLYLPIVQLAYQVPVRGIVVARHLTKETNLEVVCDSLQKAQELSSITIPTLHYLGSGRI